jgi:16S rRNA (cytidine1402-2'-O)-methyltransferase
MKLRDRVETLVSLDSPRRLSRDLAVMAEVLGRRRAVVARELTKVHEEFRRGDLPSLAERYAGDADSDPGVKGEVVILVEGASEPEVAEETLRRHVVRRLDEGGVTARDLAREVAGAYGIGKNRAYRLVVGEIERRAEGGA